MNTPLPESAITQIESHASDTNTYTVILFYHFAPISDPNSVVTDMRKICTQESIRGRIILSEEGINGTCAGTHHAIQAYKEFLRQLPGFSTVWFKEQTITHIPFPKLSIRVRSELVTLRMGELPVDQGGIHLSPTQVNELATHSNVVFLDTRNEIESRIGKFAGAITPAIKTFREFPQIITELDKYKDHHIITYCTGGIRCEKATVLLKKNGFKHVYQIDGGIYNYCTQYPSGLFKGTCFVFDDRMKIGFGEKTATHLDQAIPDESLISTCEFCHKKTARVVNDERVSERVLRVCCESCDAQLDISRLRSAQQIKERLAQY
jgi:UPF0176 protein